ncbi:hypothetical protein LTR97_000724 [Elasticomyces elasticus]|uniref:Glycosyltransferase family 31 protein n=1 Tax=Elasticomyces elasticus TaxID=574655 RepID=A0AAN7ZWI8_9PEZI|nr:hypothetical protein LTR97_000724 [Elasticomyces elasticus]
MAISFGRPRALIPSLLLLVLFGFGYSFWPYAVSLARPKTTYPYDVETPQQSTAIATDDRQPPLMEADIKKLLVVGHCAQHPDPGTVAVILMTGATEGLEKLSTQLVTSLSCVQEPLIFSDLARRLGQHVIHDVLADVSPEIIVQRNVDFYVYRKQHELAATGRETDIRLLGDSVLSRDDRQYPEERAVSRLDKYKILHAIELAWRLQPDKEWYCFLHANSYLSWPNLLDFLSKQDSSGPWYFGEVVAMLPKSELPGVNSGGGFILSGRVVRDWNDASTSLAGIWDSHIDKAWSAKDVLETALNDELHVQVTDAALMMPAEGPERLAFEQENWCTPLITLGLLESRQLDLLYHTELAMDKSLLLFKDLHAAYNKVGYPFKSDDWDNGSDDPKYTLDVVPNHPERAKGQWEPKDLVDPNQNYLACEIACIQQQACFQFSFTTLTNSTGSAAATTTACHLSRAFGMGSLREPESPGNGEQWTTTWSSGWRSDRISRWIDEHQTCP